jgi:hypothetical protein
MFGVPESIVNSGGLTVVRTDDVTDKCARIALHTAMTAPEGSNLFLYGSCLNATSRVLDAIERMCPFKNIYIYKPGELVVVREEDGSTVTLRARPGSAASCRGDNPSHVFVINPGYLDKGMCAQFLYPMFQVAGRKWVFVGQDDQDMDAASDIYDPPRLVIGENLSVVHTKDVIDTCAQLALITAMIAPAESKFFVYGTCLKQTTDVIEKAASLCDVDKMSSDDAPGHLIIDRKDGTTVTLVARPASAEACRGDNPSHVFVLNVGCYDVDMCQLFLVPLFKAGGRKWVFVGTHHEDLKIARRIYDPDRADLSIVWEGEEGKEEGCEGK